MTEKSLYSIRTMAQYLGMRFMFFSTFQHISNNFISEINVYEFWLQTFEKHRIKGYERLRKIMDANICTRYSVILCVRVFIFI